MVTILYFARLREALDTGTEQFELPGDVGDLASLSALLARRGGAWAREFGQTGNIRAAINQTLVQGDHALSDGDEIAFFPPVTGG